MKSIHRESGITLIESLITAVILSFSVLAVASMQTKSLKLNQSALNRSQANTFAYEMIEKIRINRGENANHITYYNTDFETTSSSNPNDKSTNSAVQIAASDIASWKSSLKNDLPSGEGAIACVEATRVCKVSIRWSDEFIFGGIEDEKQPGESQSEFFYESRL